MIELSVAQRSKLSRMRGYKVKVQFETRAVLVVHIDRQADAKVIDVKGQVYSLRRYLLALDWHLLQV
jgi:hypothetical protein